MTNGNGYFKEYCEALARLRPILHADVTTKLQNWERIVQADEMRLLWLQSLNCN